MNGREIRAGEPLLLIAVPVEGPVTVTTTATSEAEASRLRLDLELRPNLSQEVAQAVEDAIPQLRRGSA